MAKVVENGLREHITAKWEGKDINIGSETDTMILNAGQMVLVFITMSIAVGFVAIILCFENIFKKIFSNMTKVEEDSRKHWT
jgi:hypothetical protein